MVVVDAEERVADLNPAALSLLGVERKQALGRPAGQVWGALTGMTGPPPDPATLGGEIEVSTGGAPRWFEVTNSALDDRSGFHLGRLIVLHDVTERKQAEARLVAQQRALAMTEERVHLARELHDGLGQILGYVKFRSLTARDLLALKQYAEVDACLANLAAVAHEAHIDVREFLLAVKSDIAPERAFVTALRQYIGQFSDSFQIRVGFDAPDALPPGALEPTTEVQLLRIVQEALTNARKHAGASCIQVSVAARDSVVEVRVEDDGRGFDLNRIAGDGPGYGIRFMRERAAEIEGRLAVRTAPGRGTQIVIEAPLADPANAGKHGAMP
jgi:signal transduction histidine kinase